MIQCDHAPLWWLDAHKSVVDGGVCLALEVPHAFMVSHALHLLSAPLPVGPGKGAFLMPAQSGGWCWYG